MLEGLGELAQLPGRADVVVPEDRHARRRRRGQPARDELRQPLPDEREHHPPEDLRRDLPHASPPSPVTAVAHPLTAPASPRTK